MDSLENRSSAQSFIRTNDTNPSPSEYDILVLGSGEAGKYIAWTLAKSGKRVALVERRYIGGSCSNIA